MGKAIGKVNYFSKRKYVVVTLIIIFLIIINLSVILNYVNQSKVKKQFITILDTMNNLGNYSIETNVNVYESTKNKKNDDNLNSIYKQDFDFENGIYHVKVENFNKQNELYNVRDEEEDISNNYYSIQDNKWILYSDNSNYIKKNDLTSTLYEVKKIKKIKSDIKNLKKYNVKISTNKIMSLDLFNQIKDLYNIDYKDLSKMLDLNIYVNKNNYMKKVVISLFDEVKDININNTNYLVKKFEIELNYSNYNKLQLIIPDEIINNAEVQNNNVVESNEDLPLYTENQIMYDVILAASTYCKESTINFNNYNGELNKYLNLSRYDVSNIKSGIIKIDDKCHVTVKREFRIRDKHCTYDIENAESCK